MSDNHQRFPYDPFNFVTSVDRQNELRTRVERLVIDHSSLMATIKMSEFGTILYTISGSSWYGNDTDEKAVSWCFVVSYLSGSRLTVTADGLVEANRDKWQTGRSWGHIIVSFKDPRHGTVGGSTSYTDGSFADAEREIDDYERHLGGINLRFIRNEGDAAASANTVRTMFAFRTGGFAGFAREWNRVFLGK